jgi:hypothetical protein
MCVATADHHSVSLAGPAEIVGVAAFAANQFRILAAADRLADAEFGQRKCGFGGSVIHLEGLSFGGLLSIKAAYLLRQEWLSGRRVA